MLLLFTVVWLHKFNTMSGTQFCLHADPGTCAPHHTPSAGGPVNSGEERRAGRKQGRGSGTDKPSSHDPSKQASLLPHSSHSGASDQAAARGPRLWGLQCTAVARQPPSWPSRWFHISLRARGSNLGRVVLVLTGGNVPPEETKTVLTGCLYRV